MFPLSPMMRLANSHKSTKRCVIWLPTLCHWFSRLKRSKSSATQAVTSSTGSWRATRTTFPFAASPPSYYTCLKSTTLPRSLSRSVVGSNYWKAGSLVSASRTIKSRTTWSQRCGSFLTITSRWCTSVTTDWTWSSTRVRSLTTTIRRKSCVSCACSSW